MRMMVEPCETGDCMHLPRINRTCLFVVASALMSVCLAGQPLTDEACTQFVLKLNRHDHVEAQRALERRPSLAKCSASHSRYGWPLLAAVRENLTDMTGRLLTAGASTKVTDSDGRTVFAFLRGDSAPIMDLLIRHGANVNRVERLGGDRSKGPAFFHFVESEFSLPTLRRAIEGGADVNARDGDGNTALHWAVLRHCQPCALLLLNNGASPSVTNGNGFTPLDVANDENRDSNCCLHLVELLASRGGRSTGATTKIRSGRLDEAD